MFVENTIAEMQLRPAIISALNNCNDARRDMLISMAYQMGVPGLAGFKNTLAMISQGNFDGASRGMLNSLWVKQTPERAQRHAEVMRSGNYDIYKGLI